MSVFTEMFSFYFSNLDVYGFHNFSFPNHDDDGTSAPLIFSLWRSKLFLWRKLKRTAPKTSYIHKQPSKGKYIPLEMLSKLQKCRQNVLQMHQGPTGLRRVECWPRKARKFLLNRITAAQLRNKKIIWQNSHYKMYILSIGQAYPLKHTQTMTLKFAVHLIHFSNSLCLPTHPWINVSQIKTWNHM